MVQVKVAEGILEGEKINNEFGGSYYSFKGIPYAAPPVGDLRFKAPQPMQPWQGTREAKAFGPVAPQLDWFIHKKSLGLEDCLYANVYTPNITPKEPYPVMVWIHGGGFIWGSGNDDMYGPEFLIKRDVILVTFNYRLEALGFLCLHTKEIPGNAGMKDQAALLRWVQKNIENFGGDPDNVTIFGESAGSASVSYHLVSPLSKGLFKRAILQSGSAMSSWSKNMRPKERALKLAKKLGCCSEDDRELFEFFKSVPFESLICLRLPVTICEAYKAFPDVSFGVVNEKDFGDNERFYFEVKDGKLPSIHPNVDVIIGYTEHEGIVGFGEMMDVDNMISQANSYPEFFSPKWLTYNCSIEEQLKVGKDAKEFYYGKEVITTNNIEPLLKYISSDMIVYGAITFARKISLTTNNNVYLYKFTCKSKRNVFRSMFGADQYLSDQIITSHCDDLAYLFPVSTVKQEIDTESKEYQMIQTVTKLWANFAKNGNPTPDGSSGANWEPYNLGKQHYLDIGERLVLNAYPEKEEVEFWDGVYKQYYPYFLTI